ncbi:MAG: hypothetical protein ABFS86_03380 [Planctomycetota bacterium]
MRRLERGASYVPLIIVVVLLVVAIVWAYIKHDEADKLAKDLATADRKAKVESDRRADMAVYLNELSDYVGFSLTDSDEAKGKLIEYKIDRDAISEFIKAKFEELKALKRDFPEGIYDFTNADGGRIEKTEGGMVTVRYVEPGLIPSEGTLEGLYVLMRSGMDKMLVDMQAMFTVLKDAKSTAKSDVEGRDKTIGEKDAEIQRITADRNSLQASRIQLESDLKATISGLEDAKRALEVELDGARKDSREEVSLLNNEIAALKQNIIKLKKLKEIVEAPIGPDGEILAVAEGQNIAVINRGKFHHLQAGLTFDVYTLGKGAAKVYKGVITVLDVDTHTAKVRIIKTNNLMNPIVKGDQIESLAYNADQKLNFVLLGRFQKYGRSDAMKRLEQIGQGVQKHVDIYTNYLVLGAPENEDSSLEDSDDYRRAKELGIRVITEKQLSTFLLY